MKPIIFAVDPGKSGGICKYYVNTDEIVTYPMPTIGKEYDIAEVSRLLSPGEGEVVVHAIVENVHAIQGRAGATSNFQFGKGAMLPEALFYEKGYRFTKVTPTTWQKLAWEGVTKQKDNKETSLIAAKRIFPGHDFTPSARSSKPHDGMVDAALMAYYGKLTYVK